MQHTKLELQDVMRRTNGYFHGGIPVIWINLLKPARMIGSFDVEGTKIKIVPKYAAHAWERWVHEFGDHEGTFSKVTRGHLWFLDPKDGGMWRGRFFDYYLYRDGSDYHDENGDYQSYDGGWYRAKQSRTLALEGPFNVAELRIKRCSRMERKRNAFYYPSGRAAWLLTPTDDHRDGPQKLPIRMHTEILTNGTVSRPRLQIEREERWDDVMQPGT